MTRRKVRQGCERGEDDKAVDADKSLIVDFQKIGGKEQTNRWGKALPTPLQKSFATVIN